MKKKFTLHTVRHIGKMKDKIEEALLQIQDKVTWIDSGKEISINGCKIVNGSNHKKAILVFDPVE